MYDYSIRDYDKKSLEQYDDLFSFEKLHYRKIE